MSVFTALVFSLFVPTLGLSGASAASRCWLPGAMVEVEIVQPVMQRNRDGDEKMVDLVVEIVEVFTGTRALKGKKIQINPVMAFRFPPERWCAYGTSGIHGESSEADFTDLRGGILARSVPLKPDEVERLQVALAQRLSSSGEPVTTGEIEERVSQIQSMTWDEIFNQPFP